MLFLGFLDQRGKFADFFGRNMTVDEIVKKIEKHITADRKKRERRKKGPSAYAFAVLSSVLLFAFRGSFQVLQ